MSDFALNCGVCGALLLALAGIQNAHAADMPDPEQSDTWAEIRQSEFPNQTLQLDPAGDVLSLRMPLRAQDAATVPIAITTHLAPTDGRSVRKLYLVVDRNPAPIAGIFTFAAAAGRVAAIETRVRIEEYSHVRAIAQLSDGSTFMVVKYIKAAGGCSSPTGVAPDLAAFKARVRLRTEGEIQVGQVSSAHLMIQHPNTSGLARDQLTQLFIPAYYVRSIRVSHAGQLVLSAEVNFSISENPNLRFKFVPESAGELKATIIDTRERIWEGSVDLTPVPPSRDGVLR